MGDDVLDREEVERRVTKVCAPGSGDPAAVSDAEDRRGTLLAHDAALRERVAELEGALCQGLDAMDVMETNPCTCGEDPWEPCGHCDPAMEFRRRARRALDKGEDDG